MDSRPISWSFRQFRILVCLTSAEGTPWCEAAKTVAQAHGVALTAYRLGPDADLLDVENAGPTRLGISSEGAMLIRPDGFVAWRTRAIAPGSESLLEQVFSRILCRSNVPTRL